MFQTTKQLLSLKTFKNYLNPIFTVNPSMVAPRHPRRPAPPLAPGVKNLGPCFGRRFPVKLSTHGKSHIYVG